MAGWLALAISKDCGCNSRSLQDDWGMTWWLAPTTSKDFGCNCRPPRDGWEMAGWLALGICNDSRCNFQSLGDVWEMAGRTPVVLEHPIQQRRSVHQTTTRYTQKQTPDGRVVGSGDFKTNECEFKSPGDGQEMAGRWLDISPGYFQRLRV